MEKKIDLHIHTTKSDGFLSPNEVIDMAHKNGVDTIAIADHDTIDAYNEELFDYAKKKNVNIIPAVEISTKTKKAGVHVLGYNIDYTNSEFLDKLYEIRNARHIYLHDVSEKLMQLGYKVDVDELDKIDSVTKAHIASNVVDNVENKRLLEEVFGHIPNRGEFIEAIMNEGCPAYAKKKTVTPKEAAKLIRIAGGKVVLAHPVAYVYEDGLTQDNIKDLVDEMNADGIESNYIYIHRSDNDRKIDDTKIWNEFAKKNNLHTTIGSDFHYDDNIAPVIGLLDENINFEEGYVNSILDFLKN